MFLPDLQKYPTSVDLFIYREHQILIVAVNYDIVEYYEKIDRNLVVNYEVVVYYDNGFDDQLLW